MATKRPKVPITPEETVELLARFVRQGKISRSLLCEIIKIGLEEQKRGKAIHHVRKGRVDHRRGAEIARLDEDRFRELLGGNIGDKGRGRPGQELKSSEVKRI